MAQKKGCIPWWVTKGLPHPMANPEARRKDSEAHKGKTPWNKGIECYPDTKDKISLANTGKERTPEFCARQRTRLTGDNNPSKRPDVKQKISLALKGRPSPLKGKTRPPEVMEKLFSKRRGVPANPVVVERSRATKLRLYAEGKIVPWNKGLSGWGKKLYASMNKETREKQIQNTLIALSRRPTKPEKRICDIITAFNLPYKYTGDGTLLIGYLNPDYTNCNGAKKVIEVFGCFFHDPKVSRKPIPLRAQEPYRKAIYASLGFDCLVLWDDEMEKFSDEEIADRIKTFTKSRHKPTAQLALK